MSESIYTIEQATKEKGYTVALSKEGKKKYLLSKYYPQKEALERLGEDFGNKQTIWVLIGFGMGYMMEELIKQVGNDVRLLILEPSSSFLEEQLKYAPHLKSENYSQVKYFTGDNTVELELCLRNMIPREEMNNVKLITLKSYEVLHTTYCKTMTTILRNYLKHLQISNHTTIGLRKVGIQNTLANRYAMKGCYDLSVHKKKYEGIPALIVSAGPSLDKNIEQIKNFKGIIFCVGRTLSAVMAQGVTPDFVVSVDAYDVIYETFGENKEHHIPLITIPQGNHKVVATSYGPQYFLHNDAVSYHVLGVDINMALDMYGTVASLCLSTARYMGCGPIIFIGQDLAYTENKYHGSQVANEKIGIKTTYTNAVDLKESLPKVRGYYGGSIFTGDKLLSYLRWIENFIQNHRGEYINCTEGGAYIEGAIHMPFKECIERYCTKEKPVIEHHLIQENKDKDVDKGMEKACEALKALLESAGRVEEAYGQLVDEYTHYYGKRKNNIRMIMKVVEEEEAKIKEVEKGKELLSILMEDIELLMKIDKNSKEPLNETADQRLLRNIRLNHIFYEAFGKGLSQLLEMIKESLHESEAEIAK